MENRKYFAFYGSKLKINFVNTFKIFAENRLCDKVDLKNFYCDSLNHPGCDLSFYVL